VLPVPEDGSQLSDAVEFSLSQNIPLSPAEVVFDFEIIEGPFPVNGVQSVRVIVSAYPSMIAEMWSDVMKQAGITAISLVPESQAVAHAVVPDGDLRTVILVHFLKDKTILAIVSQGFVCFATTVAHAIDNPGKILESHDGEKIAESVELLAVRDELQKIHSYWASKQGIKSDKDPKNIKSIIVTGHVSHMSDVADYLSKHSSVPAALGNVWTNAFSLDKFVPDIEFEQSLPLAAAVGAALQK
jgi:Tfp pilus assembly PilM family ATPase